MNIEGMKQRILAVVGVTSFFFVCNSALAQTDTARVVPEDSIAYGWNYISKHIGGDLFVEGDAYWLHFGRVGFFSLTGGGGIGAELRFRPAFAGAVASVSSREMRPRPSGPFGNASLYAGAIIGDYRVEIGEIRGGTIFGDQGAPDVGFRTYFAGVSKRFGSNFFVEPDIRLMFPFDAGYYVVGPRGHNDVIIERYNLSDLFLSFTVKVGVGFDSYH
ncbi:MAG: hypothetical protein M1469_02070 [Bacteroidetes bacterium]|nr:hypothetical protein [Bacteroidota bacterium]